jgi:hypothetical protein
MRKFIRKLFEAWVDARQAQVKARMIDGFWY